MLAGLRRRDTERHVGVVVGGYQHGVDSVIRQNVIRVCCRIGAAKLVEKPRGSLREDVGITVQTNTLHFHRIAHVVSRHIAAANYTECYHGLLCTP